jgi:DNA-binding Lrp family transcriptional regulator
MAGSKRIYGKTWDVYLCILTSNGPVGVRDIWRALGLSSPSLAQYHVKKLLDLKLIEPVEGKYRVNDEEKLESLRSFLMLRGMLIPRMVVYGALLSGILVSYLVLWPWRGDFRDLVTVAVCLFSVFAFFLEAYKQYHGLTVLKTNEY